jgi:aspartate ammonia-lyase
MKTRVEKDSLGEVRVPADALYGAQTARAIANFPISGRTQHPALIRAYLRLKRAAAVANRRSGTLSPGEARLVCSAIDELLEMPEGAWERHFPVDPYQAGAGTSQNMNVNEVVANLANRKARRPLGAYQPIHPNDQVNRSQSTNDTFPTAMRLALLEVSRDLVEEILKTSRSFARHGRAWRTIPKSARTHLQDAVPMTLGQEFSAYGLTLAKCAQRVEAVRDELRELGIGGSAAGTGLTVPKGYVAAILPELRRLTGERLRGAADLREAMQSQASVAAYAGALRILAQEMNRICNDLRLLASGPLTGLNEILLPAVQPGSSIMPGKVNPSILEMANQTFYSVLGYAHAIDLCEQAGQLELNVMMPIMAWSGIEATRVATNALRITRERAIEGLRPNRERLLRYFESTPQVATALTPALGYERTAELVKQALREGRSVIEIVRSDRLIDEARLRKLLDVRLLTGQA